MRLSRSSVACLVLLAACSGGDLVLPSDSGPAAITIVKGDGQTGVVGTLLPDSMVVQVTDPLGRAVSGVQVAFTLGAGGSGGQVAPDTALTAADGKAGARWLLGGAAGQQTLSAKVVGAGSGAGLVATFHATAIPGAGAAMVSAGGDNQTAPVKSALADSLVVRVTDGLGNPVAGVQVDWSVSGGGSVSPASALTGDDGRAATQRVLGNAAGIQSATATAAGLSPVSFTHTAIAANPTTLRIVSGDAQTGVAGSPLADLLVVRLEDPDGNGVGVKGITWVVTAGGGSVSPANVTTDPNGLARTSWTLGAAVGANGVRAVYSGPPSLQAQFTATSTSGVGPPAKLAFLQSPTSSSTGATITPPVTVAVQDANGNLVASATHLVTVAIGNNPSSGTLSGSVAVNAVNGVATFSNLSIDKAGTGYTLAAIATGLTGATSAAFDILAGSANRLAFKVGPTNRVVGQAFSPALQVQVQDAGGNPVPGATNQITLTASVPGSLTGTSVASAVLGTATFPALAVSKAGLAYTLTATSPGLVSATSAAFDVAKASTAIAIASDTPDPSIVGQPVTISYAVSVVAPGAGTPTGSVSVSDGAQGCTGTVDAATRTGSCQIAFSAAGARILSATYVGDANFSGSSSPGTSHTVNKANTTTTIVSDSPDSSLVNQAVTVTFAVAVSGPGAGTPTGTVTVTADGGVETPCTAAVSAGSCSITLTTAGNRTLTATYGGDPNFNGSAGSAPHTVKIPTTTSVTSSDPASDVGQPVTFTASVSPSSASGTVQFKVDGVNRDAPVTLSGGTAQKVISDLSVGSHSITAVYGGSATHGGSTSPALVQQVAAPPTTIVLVAGNNQTAPAGSAVPVRPSVKVTNALGQAVAGYAVTFVVTAGGGNITGALQTTGADGVAMVGSWTLGGTPGVNTLEARAPGLAGNPVVFTATGTPAPDHLIFQVQPSTAAANKTIQPAVKVAVVDKDGNVTPTSGIAIHVALVPSSGSLRGTTDTTTVNGIAVFNSLKVHAAGTGYVLVASAGSRPDLGQVQSDPFDVTK